MNSLAALMFISVPALVVGMVITGVLLVANFAYSLYVFFRGRRLRRVVSTD